MEWIDLTYKILLLCSLVGGAVFAFIRWVLKQNKQDTDITALEEKEKSDVKKLTDKHNEDMYSVNEELTLMTYGVLACLKGLKEQGCNGPVTEAINKIEKHLNKSAHK